MINVPLNEADVGVQQISIGVVKSMQRYTTAKEKSSWCDFDFVQENLDDSSKNESLHIYM